MATSPSDISFDSGPRYWVSPTAKGSGLFNSIVEASPFPVSCWQMHHAHFPFDSSVVLPEVAEDLQELEGAVQAHPNALATIFGHADPSGKDEYNKVLSGRRARALYALLTRNVDIWLDLYHPVEGDSWGLASTQRMLATVVGPQGSPYYQGLVDGKNGKLTDAAVRAFQTDRHLGIDGDPGPLTRGELYRSYMDAICIRPGRAFVMKPEQFLGDPETNATGNGKAAYQGCSEFNPLLVFSSADDKEFQKPANKAARDQRNARNRRTLVLLFSGKAFGDDSPIEVRDQWPCPAWNENSAACRNHFWPDGEQRRTPRDEERTYHVDHDTMACMLYDSYLRLSKCEGMPQSGILMFASALSVAVEESDTDDHAESVDPDTAAKRPHSNPTGY